MADVVCLVQSGPDRVSFTWSQGPDAFPTYHLSDQHFTLFREKLEQARERLKGLVNAYLDYLNDPQGAGPAGELPRACLALAQAGYELRQRVFRPNDDPGKAARDVEEWLGKLYQQGALGSMEVVTEGWLPVPWNLLYDRKPDEKAFLSNDGGRGPWEPFWGIRYNLAGGQRVDPRRRMPWWEKPKVLLVVDPGIRKGLPPEQQRRLQAFADGHGLRFVECRDQLREALAQGRPDLMYWLCHATPEALVLGEDDDCQISPTDLLDLLEGDGADERLGGLVFLNACRTAEASATAGSFFKAVFGLKMSGLIATEQQTVDTFACPFGLDFLEAVLDRGEPVGRALQSLRGRVPKELEHLPQRVLLGVLYGAYCPPEIRVFRPAAPGAPAAPAAPATEASPGGKLLGVKEAPAAQPPLPERPYRSLQYYDRADRALFAGRDGDVLRFARILGDEDTRLLVLHGESGVGKTSFLRAGVIPYLEEECVGFRFLRDRSAEGGERVLAVRATNDLAGQLAQALCDFCARPFVGRTPAGRELKVELPRVLGGLVGGPPEPGRVRSALAADPALLGRALAALGGALPFGVVLIVDQCEEVFTLTWRPEDRPNRELALELLRQGVGVRGNFKLIVSLRTEYYGRLVDRLRKGVRAAVGVREYLLTDFDQDRLVEAIRRPTSAEKLAYASEVPVQKYGFRYAEGVAEEVARQVVAHTTNRQDSVLPLAQVICAQLYEMVRDRPDKVIGAEDLRRVGGVEGGMRRHVEGLLGRLFARGADRAAFQRLLAGLYRRQPDGTLTTDLLPAEEAARRWAGRMPFEDVLRVAAEGDWRLLRVSELRGGDGEQRRYVSLGHDALARVAADWDEQLGRWKRRRRAAVILGTAVTVAAAMTVSAAVAVGMWRRAEEQRGQAEEQREKAEEQVAITQAVNDFLEHDLLRQADSRSQADRGFTPDPNVTVRELLDRAGNKVGERFKDRPLVEAAIRRAVGDAYRGVGAYAQAIRHLEAARDLHTTQLGPAHLETLATLHDLAGAYWEAGRTAEAVRLYERVREQRTRKLGRFNPRTLDTLTNLAGVYQAAGRAAEAVSLLERVREERTWRPGPDHPDTLTTLNSLAGAYLEAGRLAEAIELYERVREQRTRRLGPDHPDTLATYNDLAVAYRRAGRLAEAIRLYERVWEQKTKKLGPDHPDTLTTLNNLAVAYRRAGRLAEAIRLYERVREQRTRKLGPDHPRTLDTLGDLALALQASKQFGRAEVVWRDRLAAQSRKLPADDPGRTATLIMLGRCLVEAGKPAEAKRVHLQAWALQELRKFEQASKRLERSLIPGRRLTAAEARGFLAGTADGIATLTMVGRCLVEAGEPAKAEPVLRECLKSLVETNKSSDWWVAFRARSDLGAALLGQEKYADAEPLLLEGYRGMKAREAKIPVLERRQLLAEALERLVRLYDRWGKKDRADEWRKALEATREPAKKPEGK